MNDCLQVRFRTAWLLLMALLSTLVFQHVVLAICYSTPRMAVDLPASGGSSLSARKSDGYRVERIRVDPILGQRWATVVRCGHPELPTFSLPVEGESLIGSPEMTERDLGEVKAVPMVRAGDLVHLWRQESSVRIEVGGISEENGVRGKTIRVRLLHGSTDDPLVAREIFGVVRGPANVEMLR